ncbi:MAG: hypothetical protein R2816_05750 [Flavobacteriaceae bacterium]|nr:hypothetical protein [Flavobacteriaceae bacterium]
MDSGVTLIGIFIVVLCAIPFVIPYINRKKIEKQFLLSLKELAKQNDCSINQYEIFGNFAIGIDESKNFVFFTLNEEEGLNKQCVNLSMIKTCIINKTYRLTAKKEKITDKLSLYFSFKEKSNPDIALDFYNSNVNYQLNGEIQIIEKWNQVINNALGTKI